MPELLYIKSRDITHIVFPPPLSPYLPGVLCLVHKPLFSFFGITIRDFIRDALKNARCAGVHAQFAKINFCGPDVLMPKNFLCPPRVIKMSGNIVPERVRSVHESLSLLRMNKPTSCPPSGSDWALLNAPDSPLRPFPSRMADLVDDKAQS